MPSRKAYCPHCLKDKKNYVHMLQLDYKGSTYRHCPECGKIFEQAWVEVQRERFSTIVPSKGKNEKG